jgi:hypothetical protein
MISCLDMKIILYYAFDPVHTGLRLTQKHATLSFINIYRYSSRSKSLLNMQNKVDVLNLKS